MFVISVVLVVVAFVTLMLGVLGVGDEPLRYVYASILSCLVAAVFLGAGVLRGRPSRKPLVTSAPAGRPSSWSGATPWTPPDEQAEQHPAPPGGSTSHVQILSARDATAASAGEAAGGAAGDSGDDSDDPDAARFTAALGAAGLTGPKVERLRGRFVTVEAVEAASVDELAAVPGITPDLARRVHDRLRDRAR